MGPVGISDRVNFTDHDLVARTCTANGTLLQPSRPLIAIDSSHSVHDVSQAPVGKIYATHTLLNKVTSYIVLAADLTKPYTLKKQDLYPLPEQSTTFLYRSTVHNMACNDGSDPFASECAVKWDTNAPILSTGAKTKEGVYPSDLITIVPVLPTGWAFFGELDKFVSTSPNRFQNLVSTSSSLTVTAVGAPGELVTVVSVHVDDQTGKAIVKSKTITLSLQGEYDLVFTL